VPQALQVLLVQQVRALPEQPECQAQLEALGVLQEQLEYRVPLVKPALLEPPEQALLEPPES
jgi:hypothetical protein